MSETAAPPVLPEGASLAPGYEVLEHLSRSRGFDVYEVWSEERDCRCAGKVLRPDRLDDRRARARLAQEGRLLARLTHPYFVRAYETIPGPSPVVILETLTGETLAHMVASRSRRLPAADLIEIGIQLCSAIGYLHRRGYLHLDLKPSNLTIDYGMVKVLDLSIARRPGPSRRGAGTRQYMAPEQARGERIGEKTDVWGIGAVLYEAATGTRPFEAFEERRYDQLERRADRVASHRRLPRELAQAIDGCLEPDPAARFSMVALTERLDGLV